MGTFYIYVWTPTQLQTRYLSDAKEEPLSCRKEDHRADWKFDVGEETQPISHF